VEDETSEKVKLDSKEESHLDLQKMTKEYCDTNEGFMFLTSRN
jgi:hypothetical protein